MCRRIVTNTTSIQTEYTHDYERVDNETLEDKIHLGKSTTLLPIVTSSAI